MTENAKKAYAEVESKMVAGQEYNEHFMTRYLSKYMIEKYMTESNIERECKVERIYSKDIDDIYDPFYEEVPDGEDENGEYRQFEYYTYRLKA